MIAELITFLQRMDARPKKSLSQNFLIDANVVRKIVETAEIQPGDQVLEIGPGPGALTAQLLRAGASVTAVEKDTLFAKELSRFQTPDKRLTIYATDFLQFPLQQLPPRLKVVANLPYHITTPILEKLFTAPFPFSSLTIMVQKEVADRMAAPAGTKVFGSLSLFVQFYTQFHSSFVVPNSCFYPKPTIDSTVIRLDSRPCPPVDPEAFFTLVHTAFQQRRKMLSTSLQKLYATAHVKETLRCLSLNPDARPEVIPLDQWVQLYTALLRNCPAT